MTDNSDQHWPQRYAQLIQQSKNQNNGVETGGQLTEVKPSLSETNPSFQPSIFQQLEQHQQNQTIDPNNTSAAKKSNAFLDPRDPRNPNKNLDFTSLSNPAAISSNDITQQQNQTNPSLHQMLRQSTSDTLLDQLGQQSMVNKQLREDQQQHQMASVVVDYDQQIEEDFVENITTTGQEGLESAQEPQTTCAKQEESMMDKSYGEGGEGHQSDQGDTEAGDDDTFVEQVDNNKAEALQNNQIQKKKKSASPQQQQDQQINQKPQKRNNKTYPDYQVIPQKLHSHRTVTYTGNSKNDREEGELDEPNQITMQTNQSSADGISGQKSANQRQGNQANGQGVWNNQKRIFESDPSSKQQQPHDKSSQSRDEQPTRRGSFDRPQGYQSGGYRGRSSGPGSYNQQYHGRDNNNYHRQDSNLRHDHPNMSGGKNFDQNQRGYNNNGDYANRSQRPYGHNSDQDMVQSRSRNFNDRPASDFNNSGQRDYERRGGYFNGEYGRGQGGSSSHPDAPKSGRHHDDHYQPRSGERQDYNRGESFQKSSNPMRERSGNWQEPQPREPRDFNDRGPPSDQMRDRYQGNQNYQQRQQPFCREGGSGPTFFNRGRGGFKNFSGQARSPVARHRSRSRSASPPRGGHVERRDVERRDGGQSRGRETLDRRSPSGPPADRNPTGSESEQYYFVEKEQVWISKSDYHNPNNPHYLGRATRGQGRASSNHQSAYQGRDHRTSANRSAERRSPENREAGRSQSSPRHQDERNDRWEQRGSAGSQERQGLTKSMKIDPSSPSRPKLTVIRRVQPKAQLNPESNINLNSKPETSSNAPASRPIPKSQERESAMSYGSPKSNEQVEKVTDKNQKILSRDDSPARTSLTVQQHQQNHNSSQSNPTIKAQPSNQANHNQSAAAQSTVPQKNDSQNSNRSQGKTNTPVVVTKKVAEKVPEKVAEKIAEKVAEKVAEVVAETDLIMDDDDANDIPAFDGFAEEEMIEEEIKEVQPQETYSMLQKSSEEKPLNAPNPNDNSNLVEIDDAARHHQNNSPPQNNQDQSEMMLDDKDQEPEYNHAEGGHGKKKEIIDQYGNKIEPEDNCNIYVAGIPKRTTEDTLRKHFSRFGSILNVHIIKDHNTKMPRGFAYILYREGKDANEAIKQMDQSSPFNDWKITAEHAKRGEVVDEATIEKYMQRQQSKPYGSSAVGYDYQERGSGYQQGSNNFAGERRHEYRERSRERDFDSGRRDQPSYPARDPAREGSNYRYNDSYERGANNHHHRDSRDNRDNRDFGHHQSSGRDFGPPGSNFNSSRGGYRGSNDYENRRGGGQQRDYQTNSSYQRGRPQQSNYSSGPQDFNRRNDYPDSRDGPRFFQNSNNDRYQPRTSSFNRGDGFQDERRGNQNSFSNGPPQGGHPYESGRFDPRRNTNDFHHNQNSSNYRGGNSYFGNNNYRGGNQHHRGGYHNNQRGGPYHGGQGMNGGRGRHQYSRSRSRSPARGQGVNNKD